MLNFSGKGNNGLFGGTQPARVEHVHRNNLTVEEVTRVDPDDGRRYGVGYWYNYAKSLEQGVKGLVDTADEMQRIAIERRAIDAGLRAVIRELLKTLRDQNPKHPLLDKKYRDRIFAEFEKEEMTKALKATQLNPWTPRERPDENQTE